MKAMGDDMIFWDEMWNMSTNQLKKTTNKNGTITKDSVEDTQMESED